MSNAAGAPANALPAVPESRQSASRAIGSQIAKIHAELVAPLDEMDDFRDRYPGWVNAVYDAPQRPVRGDSVTTERAKQRCLASSRGLLEAIPSKNEMSKALRALNQADQADFDVGKTRIVTAMLIDAFPNARPHNPQVYVEALVHELQVAGYGPAIVARACAAIRRTAKFVPAISEILEACAVEAKHLGISTRLGERAIAVIYAAEDTIERLEALPPLPGEAEGLSRSPSLDWEAGDLDLNAEIPFE